MRRAGGAPVSSSDPDPLEEWVWNALVVLFYLPVALGCLLYLIWTDGLFVIHRQILGPTPLADATLGLAVALPIVGLSRQITPRFVLTRRLARALARATGALGWPSCLLIAASSAVGEELLFRAVIQERLGIGVGVILFAAAHVPLERDLLLYPVFALGAGAILGGLYHATEATMAPIACHFVVNLLNLRWIGQHHR